MVTHTCNLNYLEKTKQKYEASLEEKLSRLHFSKQAGRDGVWL
jgi:hypothetical protein